MATPAPVSTEERFALPLPGPIRQQVEDTEKNWNRKEGEKSEEELKAEEEAEKQRLEVEAEKTGKTVEDLKAEEEESERQRLEAESHVGETVPKKDFEDLQHQFNVLKGKYDKERGPDLRTQVNGLVEQNNLLREQIQMLQAKKPEPQQKKSLRDNPKMKALQDEFTPEVYEKLLGAMEETVGTIKTEHEEEIKNLRGEVTKSIGMSREEIFWNSIFEKFPNYEQIRVDPKFGEFLNEEEGMSGYTRYDFLTEAFKKLNAGRVLKYLDAFTKAPIPDKLKSSPNKEKLERRLGAPAGSGAANRQDLGSKKITVEDVKKAKEDLEKLASEIGRGLWEGRDKEADKRQAELWKILDSGPSE